MNSKCHDCGVAPGEPHKAGCDVERCALCGGQAISCDCVYVVNGLDPSSLEKTQPHVWANGPTPAMAKKFEEEEAKLGGPLVWTGEAPGMAECRELGWYAIRRFGDRGWVSCRAETVGAEPDLNRYARACAGREQGYRWDRVARKLVRVQ